MTNLLTLTNEDIEDAFSDHFDEVVTGSMADVAVHSGLEDSMAVEGRPIDEFDAVYIAPRPKTSIFTAVMLERIQEKRITCNLDPTSFFIMAKKNYLYKVLEEKGVAIPATIAIAGEKGVTGIEDHMDYPIIGKMYKGFEKQDSKQIGSHESLKNFAERSEYGENLIILQEYVTEEAFDVLYINGETISLKVEEGDWEGTSNSKKYHGISNTQQELVADAAASIGTPLCRVKIVGDQVVNVESDPKLAHFRDASGKDVFRRAAKVLKGGDEE